MFLKTVGVTDTAGQDSDSSRMNRYRSGNKFYLISTWRAWQFFSFICDYGARHLVPTSCDNENFRLYGTRRLNLKHFNTIIKNTWGLIIGFMIGASKNTVLQTKRLLLEMSIIVIADQHQSKDKVCIAILHQHRDGLINFTCRIKKVVIGRSSR